MDDRSLAGHEGSPLEAQGFWLGKYLIVNLFHFRQGCKHGCHLLSLLVCYFGERKNGQGASGLVLCDSFQSFMPKLGDEAHSKMPVQSAVRCKRSCRVVFRSSFWLRLLLVVIEVLSVLKQRERNRVLGEMKGLGCRKQMFVVFLFLGFLS